MATSRQLDIGVGLAVPLFMGGASGRLEAVAQVPVTAWCLPGNRLREELCRWLPLSLDRLPDNGLPMTQDTIARRSTTVRASTVESFVVNTIDWSNLPDTALPRLGASDCRRFRGAHVTFVTRMIV